MKKMLLLLAGMACLGMFVSCSDDPQEVVIVDQGYSYSWAGTVTGSVSSTSSLSSQKEDVDGFAVLSYSYDSNKVGNMMSYTLRGSVSNDDDVSYSISFTLYKVGNDYCDTDGKKLTVTGSLEGNEFTIAEIGNYGYKFKNLKFTRKN